MLPEAAEEWPQTAWRIAILMRNVALLSCRGLQIGEYPPPGRWPRWGVLLELDQLALETAEEILCHSVIVEYALLGSIGLHPLPESDCGVLDALATVKDELFGRFAVVYRYV